MIVVASIVAHFGGRTTQTADIDEFSEVLYGMSSSPTQNFFVIYKTLTHLTQQDLALPLAVSLPHLQLTVL